MSSPTQDLENYFIRKSYKNPTNKIIQESKIGVLLINLGTPEGTDYSSMRRYLKEFLSDRRVIETNSILWWFILNLFILSTRPYAKGKDYESIWNNEKNESPLKTITRSQSELLAQSLNERFPNQIEVEWAMRYGFPTIDERIKSLQKKSCDKILIFPLYPQYSAATTATANDHVFKTLMNLRNQPTLRFVPPYYDYIRYIEALVISIQKSIERIDFKPEVLLLSYHGIPQNYADKGDPYPLHCEKTYSLLKEELKFLNIPIIMTYQSRFGSDPWLKPYTDATIKELASKGIKKLAILAPGFSVDCLETLGELDIENREYFINSGGTHFAYLPALNDSTESINLLRSLTIKELEGWLPKRKA